MGEHRILMAAPKFEIGRVYAKPLLGDPLQGMDLNRAMRMLQRTLLKRIRDKIQQSAFSFRAKKALAKSLSIKLKPSSLVILTKHPAWFPLVEGQRKGQMSWLTKAKSPIPIVTESGEVIFRTANARTTREGKWVHPGREPSKFIDKAKKEARAVVKDKLAKELKKQIRMGWARS
jgi:hypothetical protein